MKLQKILIASAFVLVGCQAPMSSQSEGSETTMVQEQQNKAQVLEATVKDLSGKEVKLSDYRGKKVYVKFWASWCPICLAGLGEVDAFSGQPMEDAVVLSVVSPGINREKSADDFKQWFEGLDFKQLPVLMDSEGILVKQLGIVGYPTNVFLDEKGEVVYTQPGHMTTEQIQEKLDTL